MVRPTLPIPAPATDADAGDALPWLQGPVSDGSDAVAAGEVAGLSSGASVQELLASLAEYRAELALQNQVLRYSEAAAEAASRRFETLFAHLPLALMVVDAEGQVEQSNALAYDTFRPTEADPPPHFLMPLVRPDHAARVGEALRQAMESGRARVPEVVFLTGSTGSFTGDLHVARLQASADATNLICAIVDQEPLLAERARLRDSRQRLATIIDSAFDAIVGIDDNACVALFNPAAEQMFGCTLSEALGQAVARYLPALAPVLLPGPAGEARPPRVRLGEQLARTADGRELPVEISLARPVDGEGGLTTLFVRDLSAQRAAQAQRDRLEQQLREAQKLQAVGTMAGGIAHDFNNILGAILGNVLLAREDVDPSGPARVSLDEIDHAARRARDLVRQILTFSRNDPPRRVELSLAAAVRDALRLVQVTLPPGVRLRGPGEGLDARVLADPTQVEQALLNLCSNAVQAAAQRHGQSGGGEVAVTLSVGQVDGAQAQALGLSAGHCARLAVSDNGPGMAPEVVERVFEPFFTTKPVGQGTGLGLSVVHGVMRSHQGAVAVHSAPGAGSVFTLYLPLAQQVVGEPTQAGAALAGAGAMAFPAQEGQGRHIFYVDDDQALVFLVRRLLGRRGYVVHGYDDPREALRALEDRGQVCHLLVTDYNMPGFSGVDLLQAARALRPALPVALASGYVTPEIEQAARAAGALALVHKPNNVEELCDAVRRLALPVDG